MKVARHPAPAGLPGTRPKAGTVPVEHGMMGSDGLATIRTINQPRGKDETVPYGTDSFF